MDHAVPLAFPAPVEATAEAIRRRFTKSINSSEHSTSVRSNGFQTPVEVNSFHHRLRYIELRFII